MAPRAGLFGNGPLNESLVSGFFTMLLLTGGRDGCVDECFDSACALRDIDVRGMGAELHNDARVSAKSLSSAAMLNSYCEGSGLCTANSSSKTLSNGFSAVAAASFSYGRSMVLDAGGCRAIQRVFGPAMRRGLTSGTLDGERCVHAEIRQSRGTWW